MNEWRPSRKRCGLKREKRKIPPSFREKARRKTGAKVRKRREGKEENTEEVEKKEAKIPELLAHPPR